MTPFLTQDPTSSVGLLTQIFPLLLSLAYILHNTAVEVIPSSEVMIPIIEDVNILTANIDDYSLSMRSIIEQLSELLENAPGTYQGMITLHNSTEDLFSMVQDMINRVENLTTTASVDSPNSYLDDLTHAADNLRYTGNLLVESMRSLEFKILQQNPSFQVLSKCWFED